MAVQIIVKDNVREFERRVDLITSRQIPFAVSKAINDTLKEARSVAVGLSFPISFSLRNRAFPRAAMRIRWANKRTLTGHLYDRFEYEYLERQAVGGIKKPRGQTLAVPKEVRRSGRGVPAAQRPRQLLARSDTFRARIKTGNEAIFQRTGRGLIYRHTLAPQAVIKPVFTFYRDMERVTAARFPRNFESALAFALRTAR